MGFSKNSLKVADEYPHNHPKIPLTAFCKVWWLWPVLLYTNDDIHNVTESFCRF